MDVTATRHKKGPVLCVTSEAIRPVAENTRPPGSKAGATRKRDAARALRKELEQSVARTTGHLKAAGATEEDIRAAFPGLISARLALDPVELVLDSLGLFVLLAAITAYVWLADSPEFVRRGGFLLYPLLWTSDWNDGLAEATRHVFVIGMGLGALLLAIYHNPLTRVRVLYGPTLAQQTAKRFKRLAVVESLGAWLYIPAIIGVVISIVFSWIYSISALSLARGSTRWNDILVALCSIWSLFICSFLFFRLPRLSNSIQYYRFPGFSLLKALSEALDAVRDEHLWFDFEHRLIIARELAKAADILEGPMLHRFVGETGGMGAAVVGPRLAALAAALRRKLIWVATPTSETREYLERFLRDAVIAAAVGKIDSLGSGETVDAAEATIGRARIWLARLVAFAKGAAIAIIPFVLVWLALRFGFMTLSSEADKTTAQNAALLWFVLSVVRMLDPSSFKDISDAVLKSPLQRHWGGQP